MGTLPKTEEGRRRKFTEVQKENVVRFAELHKKRGTRDLKRTLAAYGIDIPTVHCWEHRNDFTLVINVDNPHALASTVPPIVSVLAPPTPSASPMPRPERGDPQFPAYLLQILGPRFSRGWKEPPDANTRKLVVLLTRLLDTFPNAGGALTRMYFSLRLKAADVQQWQADCSPISDDDLFAEVP